MLSLLRVGGGLQWSLRLSPPWVSSKTIRKLAGRACRLDDDSWDKSTKAKMNNKALCQSRTDDIILKTSLAREWN